jgi:hypothetical protein
MMQSAWPVSAVVALQRTAGWWMLQFAAVQIDGYALQQSQQFWHSARNGRLLAFCGREVSQLWGSGHVLWP